MKIPFLTREEKSVETKKIIDEAIGDGGAVFISDATEEEFEEYQHNEVHGWGKFKQIWDILKK